MCRNDQQDLTQTVFTLPLNEEQLLQTYMGHVDTAEDRQMVEAQAKSTSCTLLTTMSWESPCRSNLYESRYRQHFSKKSVGAGHAHRKKEADVDRPGEWTTQEAQHNKHTYAKLAFMFVIEK